MKKLILAVFLIAVGATAFAARPSLDELALRVGVRDWFVLHSAMPAAFNTGRLSMIYRADLEFSDPTTGESAPQHGLQAYAALWNPRSQNLARVEAKLSDDVKISVEGSKAVTTFNFRPEGKYKDGRSLDCHSRVRLTWQRHDGMWQIVREELAPLRATPAEFATAK